MLVIPAALLLRSYLPLHHRPYPVTRSLIAGGSSRHLSLSDGMAFPVIDLHEQRVFLPVPWFSPRSRHRSPHHGVRKLRGLDVTRAVRFD
jgi:hypothetical protein